jgi:hypothetical protein
LDFVLFDYFITCVLFHLDKASEKDNRLWNNQCRHLMFGRLRPHHNTSLQTISKQIKYRKIFKRTEMKSTVRQFIITTYRLLVTVYDSRRPVDVNFMSEAHSTHTHFALRTRNTNCTVKTFTFRVPCHTTHTTKHFYYYNTTTTHLPAIHSSYALQRTYWHPLVTKTGSHFNCLNDQSQFHSVIPYYPGQHNVIIKAHSKASHSNTIMHWTGQIQNTLATVLWIAVTFLWSISGYVITGCSYRTEVGVCFSRWLNGGRAWLGSARTASVLLSAAFCRGYQRYNSLHT